jgi:hypothetical protein
MVPEALSLEMKWPGSKVEHPASSSSVYALSHALKACTRETSCTLYKVLDLSVFRCDTTEITEWFLTDFGIGRPAIKIHGRV